MIDYFLLKFTITSLKILSISLINLEIETPIVVSVQNAVEILNVFFVPRFFDKIIEIIFHSLSVLLEMLLRNLFVPMEIFHGIKISFNFIVSC